jgi:hypothetical protein
LSPSGPLIRFAEAVEATPFAVWATGSALAYPVANTAHVIGAILLVGAIGLLDLRILGYARGASLPALARSLQPLAVSGFVLMVFSGAVLFAADASALIGSSLFLIKLGLILLAGINALAFRAAFARCHEPLPGLAKGLAAASLGLWLAVVVAGRWIAYA